MALVTVLLVLALATLAATALLSSADIAIHRTTALRDTEEGWWVALGVEAWVLGILKQDAQNSPYDGLDEAWAQPVDYLPIDQGHVSGRLVDAQGFFNLNDLAADGQAGQRYRAQFKRLLGLLDTQVAPDELIASIVDWTDADQVASFPQGAEDTVYLSLDPPYRAANRPFTTVSELLAVHGMTPELYRKLATLVTVLPYTGQPINVNTAEPLVLQSLSTQVDADKLQQFLARRKEQPAQAKQEVQDIFGADAAPYDVKSSFFQIRGAVFVGSSRVGLYSLIYRGKGTATVLAHSADPE